MEANPAWGNRVVGASGPKHEQAQDQPGHRRGRSDNGMVITPRHIHAAVRKYLGIETTDPRFNLRVPADEKFDFFNPALKTGYPSM